MKKSNRNKMVLLILLNIFILICASTIIVSAEETEASVTEQPAVVVTTIKEEKFRVGPTVKIRPVNDIINKSADGIIELYFDNPSLNDVPLNVDLRINVPSGIHIYGQGFGEAQAAGTLYAKFEVPPGTVRTAYINIKAEKTGDFYAQFSGLYYPGDNRDNYQPLSLSHPFRVYEPSPDPDSPDLTNPSQIGKDGFTMKDRIYAGIIIAIFAGLIGLFYKFVEIRYSHVFQTKKVTESRTIEGKVTENKTTETTTQTQERK